MKKVYLFLLLCGVTFTACDFENNTNVGTTKSYAPFLGKTFNWDETTLPEQHLQFSLGKIPFTKPIRLGLYYQSTQDGSWTIPVGKELLIFKNGKQLSQNEFTIEPNETAADIAFRFQEGAKDKKYKIGVRLLNAGDLDILNGTPTQELIKQKQPISNVSWTIKHKIVMNPLKEGLLFGFSGIVAILFIWILFLRPIIFERFKVRKVRCEYPNGEKIIPLKGNLKVVLTAKKQQQGFFEKLFVGKTIYVRDEFWEDADITIAPRNKKSIRFNKVPDSYSITDTVLVMGEGESVTITNGRKQKAEFTF